MEEAPWVPEGRPPGVLGSCSGCSQAVGRHLASASLHSCRSREWGTSLWPSGRLPRGVPGSSWLASVPVQELMARGTVFLPKPWAPPLCNPWGPLPLPAHPGGPRPGPSLCRFVEGLQHLQQGQITRPPQGGQMKGTAPPSPASRPVTSPLLSSAEL